MNIVVFLKMLLSDNLDTNISSIYGAITNSLAKDVSDPTIINVENGMEKLTV